MLSLPEHFDIEIAKLKEWTVPDLACAQQVLKEKEDTLHKRQTNKFFNPLLRGVHLLFQHLLIIHSIDMRKKDHFAIIVENLGIQSSSVTSGKERRNQRGHLEVPLQLQQVLHLHLPFQHLKYLLHNRVEEVTSINEELQGMVK